MFRAPCRNPVRVALDLLYPELCPGCDDPLEGDPFPALCRPCQFELHPLEEPFCGVCGEKFHGVSFRAFECPNCGGQRLAFDFARAGYHSHELVRGLIHRFKYRREVRLATVLGQLLLKNWDDQRIQRFDDWILTPVPLHPRKMRQRQFNQAAELCKTVSEQTRLPWVNALRRRHSARVQASLDRTRRLINLAGAFRITRRKSVRQTIRGSKILLVDDVLTTGATAHECAKVLKLDGDASMVAVITVARAGSPPLG